MRNKLIYAFLPMFLIIIGGGLVGAQTTETPPDFPVNDNALVDPNATDFSSDIFSQDFGTDGTNDATDTTVTTETAPAITPVTPPVTAIVTDTTTGPKENAIFWISFLVILLVLQTTRQLVKEKQRNDVF